MTTQQEIADQDKYRKLEQDINFTQPIYHLFFENKNHNGSFSHLITEAFKQTEIVGPVDSDMFRKDFMGIPFRDYYHSFGYPHQVLMMSTNQTSSVLLRVIGNGYGGSNLDSSGMGIVCIETAISSEGQLLVIGAGALFDLTMKCLYDYPPNYRKVAAMFGNEYPDRCALRFEGKLRTLSGSRSKYLPEVTSWYNDHLNDNASDYDLVKNVISRLK